MNSPAESGVIRTYIETLLEMPWDRSTQDHNDLEYAGMVLEEDHYGLEQVKERILEFLAVRALTKKRRKSDTLSCGTAGYGKNIDRKIACTVFEKEICPHFFRRSQR